MGKTVVSDTIVDTMPVTVGVVVIVAVAVSVVWAAARLPRRKASGNEGRIFVASVLLFIVMVVLAKL